MLLPLGSDQKANRTPKLTIGLIVACFVIYIVTFWIHQVTGVMVIPAARQLESVERELIIRHLDKQGERNPVREYWKIMTSNEAQEFQEQFREDLRAGEIVPKNSRGFMRWEQAYQDFIKARKKDVMYMLGYVPKDPGIVSIFTHMFLHGNFWHWLFNMYFLWLVGVNLEDIWGRKYFILIYLTGGVIAALSHHLLNASSDVPLVGASGAIAALMGAYLVRFYHARLHFYFFKWDFWLQAWIPFVFWIGRDVYAAIKYFGQSTGVALWAHIGGYAFGAAMALILKKMDAEKTFIAKSLEIQDIKDEEKKKKKEDKKQVHVRSQELEDGIYHRKIGEYDKAARYFNESIANNPQDFEAREELVRMYFQIDKRKEAALAIGGIVGQYLDMNMAEQAVAWYGELTRQELVNDAIGPWMFKMAQELHRRGALEGAIINYRGFAQAVPQDPMAPKALFTVGHILMDRLGKPEKAAAFFEHIMKVYPDWMSEEVKECLEQANRRAGGQS